MFIMWEETLKKQNLLVWISLEINIIKIFLAYVKKILNEIPTNEDGLNSMIIYHVKVPMVIESHPNGTDGCQANMMTGHFLTPIHSTIPSLKESMIGKHQQMHSKLMFQDSQ